MDLFIGEEKFAHQGFGPFIISQFLRHIVFANLDINECYIEPAPENIAAIRAYEKAGFSRIKNLTSSHGEAAGVLMHIARANSR